MNKRNALKQGKLGNAVTWEYCADQLNSRIKETRKRCKILNSE